MGEIKSTLDLVMERTKHMTLSAEERREQALSELRGTLNGMIQRFLDGTIHLERFREEHQRALSGSGVQEPGILFHLLSDRVDPDGENDGLLELMERVCGANTSRLSDLLEQYRLAVATQSRLRLETLRAELRDKRGIHGTSVRPNLDADPLWAATRKTVTEDFRERIALEMKQLSESAPG